MGGPRHERSELGQGEKVDGDARYVSIRAGNKCMSALGVGSE